MGLKDLFVKSEEMPVEEKKPLAKPTHKAATPSNVNNLVNGAVTVTQTEKNEFTEFLNEVYKKGNFAGPDFQEFTDALKNLAGQQIPENIKFTTVFSILQAQGLTKARLLETGQKYVDLINSQVSGFTNEINGVLTTQVGDKKKKADLLTSENGEIEKQIQALRDKKDKNAELIFKINNEINEQTLSLQSKKAAFEAAAEDFVTDIRGNIEKMNLYIA